MHYYSVTDKQMVSFSSERAIFVHKRETMIKEPARIGTLFWGLFLTGVREGCTFRMDL